METKNENSRAAARDMPASWPPAMVDMERDVPGKTAEVIWQRPIQMAWPSDIRSTSLVGGLVRELQKSTAHMMTPPIKSDHAMMVRLSRFSPIFLCSR